MVRNAVGFVMVVGLAWLCAWQVTHCSCAMPPGVAAVAGEVPAGTSAPAAPPISPMSGGVVAPSEIVEDPLAVAIRTVPSTGKPGVDTSRELARLFRAAAVPCPHGAADCEPDGWTLAALAWVESGFRPWAVEGDRGVRGRGTGPGLGLMMLHAGYLDRATDPYDPSSAIPAAGRRAARFWAHHARNCSGEPPHLPAAHWFSGFHVDGNSPAITSALEVERARTLLLVAGGV